MSAFFLKKKRGWSGLEHRVLPPSSPLIALLFAVVSAFSEFEALARRVDELELIRRSDADRIEKLVR